MKKSIKKFVFSNSCLWKIYLLIRGLRKRGSLKITNNGMIRIKKTIRGNDNQLIVGKGTILNGTVIHMIGNNNKIVFGSNVNIGKECSFWTEGNNITITIGNDTTFNSKVHVNAQENNTSITIGNDCMFSNSIIIRTSDSHPIYDITSGERINSAKNVLIEDHVWIAPNSKVMKGVVIGSGSIIGSDTMVTKDVPSNTLAVGHPAKVVKKGIKWTKEDVIFK